MIRINYMIINNIINSRIVSNIIVIIYSYNDIFINISLKLMRWD